MIEGVFIEDVGRENKVEKAEVVAALFMNSAAWHCS